jgi:hypothetical protein
MRVGKSAANFLQNWRSDESFFAAGMFAQFLAIARFSGTEKRVFSTRSAIARYIR